MALVQEIVVAIRNLRSENLVPASVKTKVVLIPDNDESGKTVSALQEYVLSPPQVQVENLIIAKPGDEPDKKAVTRRCGPVQVSIDIAGLVDVKSEIERIDKEIKKLDGELKKVLGKLGNEKFMSKAPAEVVAKQKDIKEELEARRKTLEDSRARMEGMLEE